MRVVITEHSGDFPFEQPLKDNGNILAHVKALVANSGYYTADKEGNQVFIPFHQIKHVVLAKDRETQKSSGIDGDAGDWTQAGDGTGYPETQKSSGIDGDAGDWTQASDGTNYPEPHGDVTTYSEVQ